MQQTTAFRRLSAVLGALFAMALLAAPAQAAPGDVSTVAGSGVAGSSNGVGVAASFDRPSGLAADGAGNVFVADDANGVVRKIAPGGVVTTFAGTGICCSWTDGMGVAAGMSGPRGITTDTSGNVYVVTTRRLRMVTPGGAVTTLAGSSAQGSVNGPAASATFDSPFGLAVNGTGDIFISDAGSNLIRKLSGGIVTTLAGSGAKATTDGLGTAASFNVPGGIVVDSSGNVFVAEIQGHDIRKIDPAGNVTTFVDMGSTVSFPTGLAIDAADNLYVADQNLATIYRITPAGSVVQIAGEFAKSGFVDGSNAASRFRKPTGAAVYGTTLFIADSGNFAVRSIDIGGAIPPVGPPINTTTTTTTTTLPTVPADAPTIPPTIVPPAPTVSGTAPIAPATSSTVQSTTTSAVVPTTPPPSPTLTVAALVASATIPPATIAGPATEVIESPAYTGSSSAILTAIAAALVVLGAALLFARRSVTTRH